jgi:hypothetical protein
MIHTLLFCIGIPDYGKKKLMNCLRSSMESAQGGNENNDTDGEEEKSRLAHGV